MGLQSKVQLGQEKVKSRSQVTGLSHETVEEVTPVRSYQYFWSADACYATVLLWFDKFRKAKEIKVLSGKD